MYKGGCALRKSGPAQGLQGGSRPARLPEPPALPTVNEATPGRVGVGRMGRAMPVPWTVNCGAARRTSTRAPPVAYDGCAAPAFLSCGFCFCAGALSFFAGFSALAEHGLYVSGMRNIA
jgi:hypothetical protein